LKAILKKVKEFQLVGFGLGQFLTEPQEMAEIPKLKTIKLPAM
jgi:hypothetical protein